MTFNLKCSNIGAALLLSVGLALAGSTASFSQNVGTGFGGANGQNGVAAGGTSAASSAAGTGSASGMTMSSQSGNSTTNPDASQNSGVNGGLTTGQNDGQTMGQSSASTGSSTGSSMSLGSLTNLSGPQGAGLHALAPSAPAVYNLQTAVQSTVETSSDLAVARKNLQRDQAVVQEKSSANLPKINTSATYTHLDSPITIPFAGSAIVVQPENTQTFDATGTLPLDITGQVRAATQAAQLQVMADRFDLDRITNGLILNAQTAYFNELRSQHQVQVEQSALADAQTQLKTTETQYNGGIGQKIDVYRARTQVAQAQQALLQAQNALALSQNNFNDVVGRDLAAPVTVQDVPGVTVGTTITNDTSNISVGSPDSSASNFFTPPTTELDSISVENDIDRALKARPELREDLVNVQAASKQIYLARAEDQPTFALGATGNYYPVTDFQTPRHSLGIFTATINIPIFDGGLAQDRVRAARDARDESQISFENDQTNVELQVRQAYLNLYTTSNQIAAANTALQQAIAARQLAQVRYANGVGLYLEVTDAESALTSAEYSQVNAVYDYFIARAQYQNAVGTPSEQPTL